MEQLCYIASQDANGGIYLCGIDEKGEISKKNFTHLKGVAWIQKSGGRLYALLREPFMMQSGITSCAAAPDGTMGEFDRPIPVHGAISAHLLVYRGRMYVSNYLSGSATLMPDRVTVWNGSSVNPTRQDSSHPHYITPAPDEKYLCVCDLGLDEIHICDMELNKVESVSLPAGSGPRHMVFSGDGRYAYCIGEMGCCVHVLSYNGGHFEYLRSFSTLPEGYDDPTASAGAIRISPDGKRLYASNRVQGGVCVYGVNGAELKTLGFVECGEGAGIREMNLIGRWLVCGDENNHRVYVFNAEDCIGSKPLSVTDMIRPWGIIEA